MNGKDTPNILDILEREEERYNACVNNGFGELYKKQLMDLIVKKGKCNRKCISNSCPAFSFCISDKEYASEWVVKYCIVLYGRLYNISNLKHDLVEYMI